MRRRLTIAVAALLLVVGAACSVLAVDALSWRSSMRSDDLRFVAFPAKSDLWSPRELGPFGTTKALLEVDDDLAYRRALQAFVLGQPRVERYSDTDLIGRRGRAQELLAGIVDSEQSKSRRSSAANLIGVLGFANAAIDSTDAPSYLNAAIAEFRRAIALDPQNADAKYNLELALSRLAGIKRPPDAGSPSQPRGGAGSGAGAGREGSGY